MNQEALFENILQLLVQELGEPFCGHGSELPTRKLNQFFLEENEALDLPGTCGKAVLEARRRGSGLHARISLSTEAVEMGCLPRIRARAERCYAGIMKMFPRAELRIFIHRTWNQAGREQREIIARIPPAT